MALQFSENRNRNIGLAISSNPRTVLSSVGLQEATQAEAEAGTILGRYMSPLRVTQEYAAFTTLPSAILSSNITWTGIHTWSNANPAIFSNVSTTKRAPVTLLYNPSSASAGTAAALKVGIDDGTDSNWTSN